MIDSEMISKWVDYYVKKGLMSETEYPICECEIDWKNGKLKIIDDTQKCMFYDFIKKQRKVIL
jgi:hypothetical protein